jgi:CBS domain-containing protein
MVVRRWFGQKPPAAEEPATPARRRHHMTFK